MAVEGLKSIGKVLVNLAKSLGLIKPQMQVDELGDKAIQSGYDPEQYDTYMMTYTSEAQIKAFCDYIKEYYNIEQYSDLRMEISVLRFDAAMEDAFVLLSLLQEGGSEACNLVRVEKLLPWVAMKEGLLKAGTAVQIKTFGLIYTVTLSRGMVLQCSQGKAGEEHPFDFPKEKFAEYFHLDKDILQNCIADGYSWSCTNREWCNDLWTGGYCKSCGDWGSCDSYGTIYGYEECRNR